MTERAAELKRLRGQLDHDRERDVKELLLQRTEEEVQRRATLDAEHQTRHDIRVELAKSEITEKYQGEISALKARLSAFEASYDNVRVLIIFTFVRG